MLELKLLLKSEVFPVTPTAWLGPYTRQQSPLFGLLSDLRKGCSWEASPALALELGENRRETSEKWNHELPGPSRKTSLPSSERALLVDKPKRIVATEAVLLQGTSERTSQSAGRPTALRPPWASTPGHRSPKHTV